MPNLACRRKRPSQARKQRGRNLDEFIWALVNKGNEQETRGANDKSHWFWEKRLRDGVKSVSGTSEDHLVCHFCHN